MVHMLKKAGLVLDLFSTSGAVDRRHRSDNKESSEATEIDDKDKVKLLEMKSLTFSAVNRSVRVKCRYKKATYKVQWMKLNVVV